MSKHLRPQFGSFRTTLLLALMALISAAAGAQTSEFTVVILPDPQNYSEKYPATFAAQTKWIVDNRTALNIQFVAVVGDMVNDAESDLQWQNADAAMRTLDGVVPYVISIGNHDYDTESPSGRSAIKYNQYFGPTRFAAYPWYKGTFEPGKNENYYADLVLGGQRFLVLALEFHPRDAVLTWASNIIAANPDAKVLLVTHSFMYSDDTRIGKCDTNDMDPSRGNDGETTWQKFVRKHAAMSMVFSGHITSGGPGRRFDLGDTGNLVNQMLSNYQSMSGGGSGYLRIVRVNPMLNTVRVQTYSPTLNSYLLDAENDFTVPYTRPVTNASTGRIEGNVRKSDCTDLEGVAVSAGGVNGTTDTKGYFNLEVPAPSTHTLDLSLSGYNNETRTAAVEAGFPTIFDNIPLTPATVTCTLSTVDHTVTICLPTNGATVTSPVRVVAGATSSTTVSYMQIYVDGVKQRTIFAKSIDELVEMSTGEHRLVVQAKDVNGLIFKTAINITVGTAPPPPGTCTLKTTDPSVTICEPANGATVTSPVRVVAGATSSAGVKYMQIYLDGTRVYHETTAKIDTAVTMTNGAHRLTVQARDNAGRTFKETVNITAGPATGNQTPTAQLTVSPASGTAPLAVSASTEGSTDPDGTIASSSIDFGNGTVLSGPTASHTYQSAGTYTVTATVTDNSGAQATAQQTVTVTSAGNQPPTADLSVTPTSGTAPLTVSASTSGSTDPDGTIASSTIDFGNGTVAAGPTASHTYQNAGTYTVTATVTDNAGATATAQQTVTVTSSGNQPPTAQLTVTPSSGTAPLTVSASTSGSTDADGTIASSTIDFGNGTVAAGPTASHTYSNPGTYTVTATVTDNSGASATATQTVTVSAASITCPAPTADPQMVICTPSDGATVSSPVRIVAQAHSSTGVTTTKIYVDGVSVYSQSAGSVDVQLPMAAGTHRITVKSWRPDGTNFYKTIYVSVP